MGAPRARGDGMAHGTEKKRQEQSQTNGDHRRGPESVDGDGVGGLRGAQFRPPTKYATVEANGSDEYEEQGDREEEQKR
jgi:hypothetical protein